MSKKPVKKVIKKKPVAKKKAVVKKVTKKKPVKKAQDPRDPNYQKIIRKRPAPPNGKDSPPTKKGRAGFTNEQSKIGGRTSKRPPSITTQLKRILETDTPKELWKEFEKAGFKFKAGEKIDFSIALAMAVEATKGDVSAAKFIRDATDGPVTEKLSINDKRKKGRKDKIDLPTKDRKAIEKILHKSNKAKKK